MAKHRKPDPVVEVVKTVITLPFAILALTISSLMLVTN